MLHRLCVMLGTMWGCSMIDLPPLGEVEAVRLSREGGLAFIPGLVRLRVFELKRCSDALRGEVCNAVEEASRAAAQATPPAGADQRFFRVELHLGTVPEAAMFSFKVPEANAPPALVKLWQAPEEFQAPSGSSN